MERKTRSETYGCVIYNMYFRFETMRDHQQQTPQEVLRTDPAGEGRHLVHCGIHLPLLLVRDEEHRDLHRAEEQAEDHHNTEEI